jgi:hypothetical protein
MCRLGKIKDKSAVSFVALGAVTASAAHSVGPANKLNRHCNTFFFLAERIQNNCVTPGVIPHARLAPLLLSTVSYDARAPGSIPARFLLGSGLSQVENKGGGGGRKCKEFRGCSNIGRRIYFFLNNCKFLVLIFEVVSSVRNFFFPQIAGVG